MTSVVIFKIENSKGLGDRKKYCMHEKNLMIKIAAFFFLQTLRSYVQYCYRIKFNIKTIYKIV